jgi:hypothetical protein
MHGFPRAEFAYRIESAPGDASLLRAPLTLAIDGVRPRSVYVDGQQGGRLVRSAADRSESDAGASFTYEDCWAAGATWTRRAVLLGGGALVVLDRYAVVESQGATRAGPVWQFGAEPRRGADWFVGPAREAGSGAGVRVTVAADRALEFGVQRQERFQREVGFAASASAVIEAGDASGGAVRFVSVIEPWAADDAGAERPARVVFSADGEAQVTLADGTRVVFAADDGWRVER